MSNKHNLTLQKKVIEVDCFAQMESGQWLFQFPGLTRSLVIAFDSEAQKEAFLDKWTTFSTHWSNSIVLTFTVPSPQTALFMTFAVLSPQTALCIYALLSLRNRSSFQKTFAHELATYSRASIAQFEYAKIATGQTNDSSTTLDILKIKRATSGCALVLGIFFLIGALFLFFSPSFPSLASLPVLRESLFFLGVFAVFAGGSGFYRYNHVIKESKSTSF